MSVPGVLIDFISVPVTVGFTSATSVIIAASQLKGLLGLKFESANFLDTLRKVITHLPEARLTDSVLGLSCITILLLLRVCTGDRLIILPYKQLKSCNENFNVAIKCMQQVCSIYISTS